ncbi:MAG TPA: serine hydrolase domain-containing protein [Verrucomicrobiae bacterium]|nr:serine hydrolase domain-containing protein [Verrucomicrobiae bacterium]
MSLRQLRRQKAATFLDSWLEYRLRHVDIVGLSVAVLWRGENVFTNAFGRAVIEPSELLTPHHIFCMASQTKMITAVLLLRLAEQGKLSLDDLAIRYLPWLGAHSDERVRRITLRHLLSHSAGLLANGNDAEHWLAKAPPLGTKQLQQQVLKHDLVFQPGERVKYSNVGYGLLGSIIEAVTHTKYTKLLGSLLDEVGIDGWPDYPARPETLLTTGYGLPFYHQRQPLGRQAAGALAAAAGLHTTPYAMCRLIDHIYLKKQVIGAASIKEQVKTQSKLETGYDASTAFGLGIEFFQQSGQPLFGHTGHVGGHVSATICNPRTKLIVSVAANAKDSPVTAIALGILGAVNYFFETVSLQDGHHPGKFSARFINEVSTVQIIDLYNKIIIIDPDDWEPFGWYETLQPISPTKLKFATTGSVYNEGELIEYSFKKGVQQARLSGAAVYLVK